MNYTPNQDAADAKRIELIQMVTELLDERDVHLAERIVDTFCQITPPQDPPMQTYLITVRSAGFSGGESRKPGNLRMNWKRLCGDCGDIVLTAAAGVAVPYLIPFAALSLWKKLWSHASIPLSREQAATLVAMWHRRDDRSMIPSTVAHKETNSLFKVYKWAPLGKSEFDAILNELTELECIEVDQHGSIWLREWVETSYE